MKVSVCMNTAHDDYSMTGLPDTHIFEYTMAALRNQTFKDFEVVIADVLYDQRKNYFEEHPEVFSVKHVPIKPNVWTSRGQVAISATKNTCLMYASGEIVVFIDDCISFNEKYLQDIVDKIKPNYCVSNPYEGYRGYKFIGRDTRIAPAGPINGTYGNVALYLERYLDLNGYNEIFDGGRGLEDCEFSLRMIKSGMEIYLINNYARYQEHKSYPSMRDLYVKCSRLAEKVALERVNLRMYRANTVPITDNDISIFASCANKIKGVRCPYVPFPCDAFSGESNLCYSGNRPELLKLYQNPAMTFDLREQRKDINATIEKLKELVK